MMQYKGYRAAVTFDDSAGVFHGEVVDTRDVITFEGDSVEQLQKEFEFSIDDYSPSARSGGGNRPGPTPGRYRCGCLPKCIEPLPQSPRARRSTHGLPKLSSGRQRRYSEVLT